MCSALQEHSLGWNETPNSTSSSVSLTTHADRHLTIFQISEVEPQFEDIVHLFLCSIVLSDEHL